MTVLAFILAIVLILVVGFLVTPVSVYVDTDQGRYEIFQRPAFRFFAMFKHEAIVAQTANSGNKCSASIKAETSHKKGPQEIQK